MLTLQNTFMPTIKNLILWVIIIFVISIIFNANAAGLSQTETSTGLKNLLNQATTSAIQQLSNKGGFNNNPEVKISLPAKLATASTVLKRLGLGNQLTQLETGMNNAAEAAMPQAKQIMINSIQQMSFTDAKNIVTGGDHAATQYLEKTNRTQLFNKLLPTVRNITNQSALSTQYNGLIQKASLLGGVSGDKLKIENYVTNKALDGLFTVMGEKESYIRNHPKEAATSAAKKILEALTQ